MKTSLERVNVFTTRHREPAHLDFYTLFHLTDNNVRNRILKENNVSPSLFLYDNKTQTTTTYLVLPKHGESPIHIMKAMFQIMNDEDFDYYVIIAEGWRTRSESIDKELDLGKYKPGDITSLPIQKKQEVLSIFGKSKDGKESHSTCYDIIRIRPEDDSSKIIRFETFQEGNEGITAHAELTVKRKWFPSMEELLSSVTTEAPDAKEHEVYCCTLGINRNGTGIEKAMIAAHKNPHVLNNAVEPVIAEELLRFKKERNCHNVSVLRALHVSSMSTVLKNGEDLFLKVITIFLSEDYKGEFGYITSSPASPDYELAIYAHREDDDYSTVTPIKKELLKR